MLDFFLSLFNVWVWLGGGILAAITLLQAYSYGPDEYYEPFTYQEEGWRYPHIHVKDEFKRFKFRKINGEWYPKINLREFYLNEAKFTIIIFIVPFMLIMSYLINHDDRPIPSSQEINLQIEKIFTPRANK